MIQLGVKTCSADDRVLIYSPLAAMIEEQLGIERDGPSRKVDHAEVRQDRLEEGRMVLHRRSRLRSKRRFEFTDSV